MPERRHDLTYVVTGEQSAWFECSCGEWRSDTHSPFGIAVRRHRGDAADHLRHEGVADEKVRVTNYPDRGVNAVMCCREAADACACDCHTITIHTPEREAYAA